MRSTYTLTIGGALPTGVDACRHPARAAEGVIDMRRLGVCKAASRHCRHIRAPQGAPLSTTSSSSTLFTKTKEEFWV